MVWGTSELYLVLRARDEASRVVRGFSATLTAAQKEAAVASQAMMRRGQALATIGVAVAVGGIVGLNALNKMTNAAIEYRQQAALTETQTDKVTISLSQLEKMGMDVARKLPVEFAKIQPTLYDIFSSIDVNAPQAAMLLENIGKASVAGQADMQVVGRATVAVLNAYKMKVTDVTKVNDVMFQLVRKGVGTYVDFTNVIGRVIPSSVKAGQTFETTAGMMAFLTRNGMSAAMASSAAARAMDSLSKPSVVKNLRAMGVSVMDASGNFRPMVDIIHDLQKKMEGLPPVIQAVKLNNIFKGSGANIQTMRFLNLALHDSHDLLGQMVKDMGEAKGASKAAFEVMLHTPAGQIALLKNQFKDLSVTLGQDLIPAKMLLLKVLNGLVTWFSNLSPTVQKIVIGFMGISAVGMVLTGIFVAMAGVISIVRASMLVMSDTIFARAIPAFINLGRAILLEFVMIAREAAITALAVLFSIGRMIAGFIALSLQGMASAINVGKAWLIVKIQAYAAATGSETSVAVQIGSWIALKMAAMANALQIAAAWLIAMGPVGWAVLGAAAVGVIVAMWVNMKKATKAGAADTAQEAYNGGVKIATSLQQGMIAGYDNRSGFKKFTDFSAKLFFGTPIPKYLGEQHPSRAPHKLAKALSPEDKLFADMKKQSDAFQKMLDQLFKGDKKSKINSANSPIVNDITAHINTLKALIKTGAKDIAAAATEIPIALKALGKGSTDTLSSDITNVQKLITDLSKKTPNQLKAMGVTNIQKLIDGLKSKEKDLMQAYDDVLYKTELNAQIKAQALAAQGADAINGFIMQMTGSLGQDVDKKQIALTLGADVVDAFAQGMAQSDPKARLAAYNALTKSVQDAYQATLDKLDAVKQTIVDKMKAINNAVSGAIMKVMDFSTAYTKAMDIAKIASETLADQNKLALDKVKKDYDIHLADLNKTLNNAQSKLTTAASNITSGIMGALDFTKAASEANMQENTFMEQLVLQAKKAKDFGTQIKQLISMGLSGDSVSQIAAAGVDAGAKIAQNLIDGGAKAITDTNELVKSVTDLADSLGTTTSESFYKAGITQAQAAVNGYIASMGPDSPYMQDLIDKGNAAVTAVASAMGETFTIALLNQSKSASAYADQIKTLISMGLSVEAIQQVLAAGDTAGSAIAASLIAGGSKAIKDTNDMLVATQKMADDIGTLAAIKYYGVGLTSAQALIDAFIADFGPKGKGRATLMSAMDDLANSMNRTSTVTINTVYTGTPLNPNAGNTPVPTPSLRPDGSDRAGGDTGVGSRITGIPGTTGSPNDNPSNPAMTGGPQVVIHAPITTTPLDPAAYAASLGFYMSEYVRN